MTITKDQIFFRVLACCETEAESQQVTDNPEQVVEVANLIEGDGLVDEEDEDVALDLIAGLVVDAVRLVVAQKIRTARHVGKLTSLSAIATAVPADVARVVRAAKTALRASTSSKLDEFFALNNAGSSEEMREAWKKSLSDEAVDQITKGMQVQEDTDKDSDLFKSVASAEKKPLAIDSKVKVKGKSGKVIAMNATSCMVQFTDGATIQVPKSKIESELSASLTEKRQTRMKTRAG